MKRTFGFVFIVISLALLFMLVGQVSMLIEQFADLGRLLSGSLDSHESGVVLGHFIYLIIHIGLMIFLWVKGRQWTRSAK